KSRVVVDVLEHVAQKQHVISLPQGRMLLENIVTKERSALGSTVLERFQRDINSIHRQVGEEFELSLQQSIATTDLAKTVASVQQWTGQSEQNIESPAKPEMVELNKIEIFVLTRLREGRGQ